MKKMLIFLLFIFTFSSLQGCESQVSDIDQAEETVTQFMYITYEISDYASLDLSVPEGFYTFLDEYKKLIEPYATRKLINENFGNFVPWEVRTSAVKNEFNLHIINLELDQITQDEDAIYMDYTLKLDLSYEDGSHEEELKSGKLQLLKVDANWKINHQKAYSYPIALKDNTVVSKVISEYRNDSYEIKLVQTKESPPLTPEDEDFDIYKSGYYGRFELWLIKDGKTVDIMSLNTHYDRNYIGFIGDFDLVDDDINGDGNADFNIGIMAEDLFEYVVFTVSQKSFDVFLFDEKGSLLSASKHHSERFKQGPKGELIITLPKDTGGYYEEKYFWNELRIQFESEYK